MKREVPFRPARLNERRKFYEKEFSIKQIKRWFKINGIKIPQICALDAGSDTGIIINKKWKDVMFYFPFDELESKIKKYVPEDIYYDRNNYNNPEVALEKLNFRNWDTQELIFDIDSDNLSCKCSGGKKICDACLNEAYLLTLKMKKDLEKDFKKIKIVYSGRGFHLHVLDSKAFALNVKEREKVAMKFSNYPIDSWVSRGHISLVRMPYSLNGLVSRKVIPMNNKFNKEKVIPWFMKN